MTPKEQKTVMITMVSLIVLLVMSLSYIWYSETNRPIFGKHASKNIDMKELEEELARASTIIDSLVKLQETVPTYELRRHPPDSLLCITCPYVENIDGVYYELLGTFHSADEARFLASQLLKSGIQSIKIFHRNGLQAEELHLFDSLSTIK